MTLLLMTLRDKCCNPSHGKTPEDDKDKDT